MPIYEYECECKRMFEHVSTIARMDDPVHCPSCGRVSKRVICAPRVYGDYEGYSCPRTGKWIEGRRAHEENLKRTGCRLFEPGEREQFIAQKAAEERALDRAVDDTVSAALEAMPSRDKETLANEVQGGADVNFKRSTI